jgi:transcriptional regulator with XRE-family HTH domain
MQAPFLSPTLVTKRPRAPALEDLRVNLIVGRARARLSQEDLAERSGVGRATISRIERAAIDDVGVDVLVRLAGVLGTCVHDLFAPSVAVDQPGDDELARRAEASDDEFLDADTVLDTVDEAAGIERYSRAGRPPLGR